MPKYNPIKFQNFPRFDGMYHDNQIRNPYYDQPKCQPENKEIDRKERFDHILEDNHMEDAHMEDESICSSVMYNQNIPSGLDQDMYQHLNPNKYKQPEYHQPENHQPENPQHYNQQLHPMHLAAYHQSSRVTNPQLGQYRATQPGLVPYSDFDISHLDPNLDTNQVASDYDDDDDIYEGGLRPSDEQEGEECERDDEGDDEGNEEGNEEVNDEENKVECEEDNESIT
jgi:hypothetical protein